MKTELTLLALFTTFFASAQVVHQFSADEGTPFTQGFTESGSSSIASEAVTYRDEAAWRVEEPDRNTTGYRYSHAISAADATTLQERGYRVAARVAFLDRSYNDNVSCHFSIGDGTRRFLVWIDETSSQLRILLQNNGSTTAINLGSADIHGFHNIAIDVAPGGTSASVLVNGEVKSTGWAGETHSNRELRFGNDSTNGRGGAAWNRVQVASRVPESDMTFVYKSDSDSYELDKVNDVVGHLHIPDTFNDDSNGTKHVTVIRENACVENTLYTSLRLPSSLESIDNQAFIRCTGFTGALMIPEGVTSIGSSAFNGCSGFTGALTIPEGVTSIDDFAFYWCSGFDGSLTLPEGLTSIGENTFYQCNGLTGSLTIPEGVTSIGSATFYWCNGFDGTLTLPEGLTSIGKNAFVQCTGLTGSLTIPEGVTSIGDSAFRACISLTGALTIPEGVTSISDSTFAYCRSFDGSLTLPSSLTSIGNSAFEGCSGLTGTLTIPEGVTSIGHSVFEDCNGLTGSLTIPEGVTSIGDSAFRDCSGFNGALTIPEGVTFIGNFTFRDCGFTGSLTIPESLTSINSSTFRECGFNGALILPNSLTSIGDSAFRDCDFTGALTLPSSLTSIGQSAFWGCSKFTGSLTIPESVTSIPNFAFYQCHKLTGALTIPENVTSIGHSAFRECGFNGALTILEGVTTIDGYAFRDNGFTGSLTIPESVTSIGEYAFQNCTGLTQVCWLGEPPTHYGTTPFTNTSATHWVPESSLSAYQALAGLANAQVKPPPEGHLSFHSAGGKGIFSWPATANESYTIEYTESLSEPDWKTYNDGYSGEGEVTITNSLSFDGAYFRLAW